MASGVHITNLNETVRDLTRLGVDVDDIKSAFSTIADEGARIASQLAPVRTGRLSASIRGNRAKNKAVIIAGRGPSNGYAGVINYGHPARHITAQRFMQRADAAIAPRAVQMLDTELTRLINSRGF